MLFLLFFPKTQIAVKKGKSDAKKIKIRPVLVAALIFRSGFAI